VDGWSTISADLEQQATVGGALTQLCWYALGWFHGSPHHMHHSIPSPGGVLEMEWINRPVVGMAYSAARSTYRCRQLSMQVWLAVTGPETRAYDWFIVAHHSSVYVLRLCCSVQNPAQFVVQRSNPSSPHKASHFRIQNLFQKTSYSPFLIQLYLYFSPPSRFLYTLYFFNAQLLK
jgi:hypothetical protein